jgi:hypothetical protein
LDGKPAVLKGALGLAVLPIDFLLSFSAWTMNGHGLVEGVRYCLRGSMLLVGLEESGSVCLIMAILGGFGTVSCEAARDRNYQMVGIKTGFSNDQTYNTFLVLLGLCTRAILGVRCRGHDSGGHRYCDEGIRIACLKVNMSKDGLDGRPTFRRSKLRW